MPFTTTPAANPAVTLTNGVQIGGRQRLALAELKRRFIAELPATIDAANAQQGFTGLRAIKYFGDETGNNGIGYAPPGDLTQGHINRLMIESRPGQFEPMAPGVFRFIGSFVLYLVDMAWRQDEQYEASLDRQGVVRLLLANYKTTMVDPQNRKVWSELTPLDDGLLPDRFRNYGGVSFNYQYIQNPGDDLWTPQT